MDDPSRAPSAPRSRTVTWSDPNAVAQAGRGRAGLDFLRDMMAGRLPAPPIIELMGIRMAKVEEGLVEMTLPAAEYLYNPIGVVHGGALATLLDSVMGCAVHSSLAAGRGYTTLEIKVNYVRGLTEAVGFVTGTGKVVHSGRQTAVAEARAVDAAGRLYATATTTCLVFDVPPRTSGT